ncbi:MAG TPA: fumarylacetoacetate hydrolase family protein [Acidimicrobiales bacterium]|jgi:2-keto-4-pentenoate hydratase/2-oxohepta-3-ene-1,7-dioic acid hydratase in catechol pathway|nr:fumarylacetoacetate hydrolase family protein [Acidimicrobiales bacterium]
MRFVNAGGRAGLLVDDTVYDLHGLSGGAIPYWPMEALVAHWDAILAAHAAGAFDAAHGTPVSQVKLAPPVPRPSSVYAIGVNYRGHAAETGADIRPIPAVFTKFPSSITGPTDEIVLPAGEGTTDWEAELAFVVGEGGRYVGARDALDSLRGFMCAQDISERFVQHAAGRQFSLGKSYDTFCPLGPAVVTIDELPNPLDLRITCTVNGTVMQDARTSDMVVDVPHLVELLSSVMTLRAGDVCLTGTPAGVGVARKPPVYLQPGDVVETEIEGLGRLRNPCVADPASG